MEKWIVVYREYQIPGWGDAWEDRMHVCNTLDEVMEFVGKFRRYRKHLHYIVQANEFGSRTYQIAWDKCLVLVPSKEVAGGNQNG